MQLCPMHFLPCLLLSQCPLTCGGLHIFVIFSGVLQTAIFSYSYVNFHILVPCDFPSFYEVLCPNTAAFVSGPSGYHGRSSGHRRQAALQGSWFHILLCPWALSALSQPDLVLRTGCCVVLSRASLLRYSLPSLHWVACGKRSPLWNTVQSERGGWVEASSAPSRASCLCPRSCPLPLIAL